MTADDTAQPEQEPTATETVSLDKAPTTEPTATEETATEAGATVGPTPGATVEIAAAATETVSVETVSVESGSIESGSIEAGSTDPAPSEVGAPGTGATVEMPPAETIETAAPASEDAAIVEMAPGATVEIKALEGDASEPGAPESAEPAPEEVSEGAVAAVPATVTAPVPDVSPNLEGAPHQLYPPYPPQQQWGPPAQQWPQAAAEPGPWQPAPPPAAPPRSIPNWIPITFAAVVGAAVVAGIVLIVMTVSKPKPADLAGAAVAAASEWRGMVYRGSIDGYRGERMEFDISVTTEGVRGTVTRPGGAKAEVVRDRSGTLMRGNKQWWSGSYTSNADKLADVWLSDSSTELAQLDTILKTDPRALARVVDLNPRLASMWRQTREVMVDGVRAIEITDGLHRLLVTADPPHRLLGVDIVYSTRNDDMPTRVTEVDATLVAQINNAASQVRGTTTPKTVTQRLMERPELDVRIQPEPLCTTPTCSAVVTLTNSGALAGSGQIVVSADGAPVATHDYTVEPGKSVSFNEQAPNRHYNDTAAREFTIPWTARVLPKN